MTRKPLRRREIRRRGVSVREVFRFTGQPREPLSAKVSDVLALSQTMSEGEAATWAAHSRPLSPRVNGPARPFTYLPLDCCESHFRNLQRCESGFRNTPPSTPPL